MQQSRLVATAFNSLKNLSVAQSLSRQRPLALASTTAGRPGDPQVFSKERARELNPAVPHGNPEETRDHYELDTARRQAHKDEEAHCRLSKETDPLHQPKPPHAPSPRLGSVGVSNPAEPNIQQKRKNSTLTLDDISCAGHDGSPWPKDREEDRKEDDDGEYFKHHKASPLSEIKVMDTRKPITRATDGTAGSESSYGWEGVGWFPEQLDTAEEALERARRIWRENAMRGDPDTPHGRVLRALRGEWF